jgi:signal peptidase I
VTAPPGPEAPPVPGAQGIPEADEPQPSSPGDRDDPGPRQHAQLPVWQESILLVGTALVLALLIKTFLVQAFYIPPSGSMRATLEDNDRILVQKVSYWFGSPQRGDIVVFDDPADWLGDENAQMPGNVVTKVLSFVGLYPTGGHLVKRVIGVAGDAVACDHGNVTVNGVVLHESSYVTLAKQDCAGHWSVKVPPGDLWVLGDNREHSADSRAHMGDPGGGFVPVDDVVGKAFVVVWPVHRWQFISRPSIFDSPALNSAASIITVAAPSGLTLVAVPAVLLRRRKNRTSSR